MNHSDGQNILNEVNKRFLLQEEYLGTNKPVNKTFPLVSVMVAAYQHAPFIRECLDGILMQKTSFAFEVLVGEDASTDGTRDICIEYAEKYPDKIRLFLRNREISHMTIDGKDRHLNDRLNIMASRGKYRAICEGDDFWTDPLKLQFQVDFMEANPEYAFCFHKVKLIRMDKVDSVIGLADGVENRDYSGREVLEKWTVPTCSVVARNELVKQFLLLPLSPGVLYPDIISFLGLAERGKIRGFDREMAVYRRHKGSFTLSTNNHFFAIIKHYKSIDRIFEGKYKDSVKYNLAKAFFTRSMKQLKMHRPGPFVNFLFKAFYYDFRYSAGRMAKLIFRRE